MMSLISLDLPSLRQLWSGKSFFPFFISEFWKLFLLCSKMLYGSFVFLSVI